MAQARFDSACRRLGGSDVAMPTRRRPLYAAPNADLRRCKRSPDRLRPSAFPRLEDATMRQHKSARAEYAALPPAACRDRKLGSMQTGFASRQTRPDTNLARRKRGASPTRLLLSALVVAASEQQERAQHALLAYAQPTKPRRIWMWRRGQHTRRRERAHQETPSNQPSGGKASRIGLHKGWDERSRMVLAFCLFERHSFDLPGHREQTKTSQIALAPLGHPPLSCTHSPRQFASRGVL